MVLAAGGKAGEQTASKTCDTEDASGSSGVDPPPQKPPSKGRISHDISVNVSTTRIQALPPRSPLNIRHLGLGTGPLAGRPEELTHLFQQHSDCRGTKRPEREKDVKDPGFQILV